MVTIGRQWSGILPAFLPLPMNTNPGDPKQDFALVIYNIKNVSVLHGP